MSKPFTGHSHGKNKIQLRPEIHVLGMPGKPIEIHLQEDMCLDDSPGFGIVMETRLGFVIGQISLDMFNEGLADIGYEIVKKG